MDPLPHADAFRRDARALGAGSRWTLAHDRVEDLELKRGHVKLNGVVAGKSDAQIGATIPRQVALRGNGVKVAKISHGQVGQRPPEVRARIRPEMPGVMRG
jgi:hypothetical protein